MILIIKHIGIEGPGTIGKFLKDIGLAVRTVELDKGQRLPEDISGVSAIIVLGGPMNVYEEVKHPFLKYEDIFLKKAIKEKVPILGICLGAQLLAKACGAKVKKAKEKEIGWYKAKLTKEGTRAPLFKKMKPELDVFQWHEDTFTIPDKGILLATSGGCENQAFRFGRNAYGLQFHIEVTRGMIEDWVKEYTKGSDNQMILDYGKIKEKFNEQANVIYRNFAKLIKI